MTKARKTYTVKPFPVPLPKGEKAPDFVNKAGLLPVHASKKRGIELLLLRPVARKKHKTPPAFQIGKGTRMQLPEGKLIWKDVEDGDEPEKGATLETLAETALREAEEELGLVLPDDAVLWDMGTLPFSSISSGKTKWMRLFAVRLDHADANLEQDLTHHGTEEVAWIHVDETDDETRVRADHAKLIEKVLITLVRSDF